MKSPRVEELVDQYQRNVQKLDEKIRTLPNSHKEIELYERTKSRFIAQVQSWEKLSKREYNEIQSNLEESYNKLESVWYDAQQKLLASNHQ